MWNKIASATTSATSRTSPNSDRTIPIGLLPLASTKSSSRLSAASPNVSLQLDMAISSTLRLKGTAEAGFAAKKTENPSPPVRRMTQKRAFQSIAGVHVIFSEVMRLGNREQARPRLPYPSRAKVQGAFGLVKAVL